MTLTDTEVTRTGGPSHPLDDLSADEIHAARELLVAAGLVTDSTRFAYLGLDEPPRPTCSPTDPERPSTAGCARSCSTLRPARRRPWSPR